MSNPLAVLTDVTDLDPEPGLELLRQAGFETLTLDLVNGRTVPDAARSAVALSVGYARIDAEILDQLPALRFIATASTGLDMIDVDETSARGIRVANLPGAATEEVAVHTLALILALERSLVAANNVVHEGGWSNEFSALPRRISSLTLGIVGYGRISAHLISIAAPLFGNVVVHEPLGRTVPEGIRTVSLEELCRTSDVMSIHAPASPQTRRLIGRRELSWCTKGTTLINAARGELIDESALLGALADGSISSAALDVLDGEPPTADNPLRSHPRVLVTPHVAYRSDEALLRYVLGPSESIVEWWNSR